MKIQQKTMNLPLRFFAILLAIGLNCSLSYAKSFRIKSVTEYDRISQAADPGDTVCWENGLYADVTWNINQNGLVVQAEKSGMVTFTGSSSVRISADRVIFSGFQFKDGSINGDVVEVSGNRILVREMNISAYHSHYFLHLTSKGSYNTVENCNFENKPPAPAGKEGTSIFQVAVDSIHPGNHIIRYCSFKNHTAPENSGGDYGMEALRIGYSYQSKFISRTIVEYCYFTRCNGDGEIISNKARENIFRYNTFDGNNGSHLTLRHGRDNVVYGNFFLHGAGIRIKEGQNLMVYNNYFSTGADFAIRLENYKVDPLKNIVIAHNSFTGSGTIKLGGKGDFQPKMVRFCNNLIANLTTSILSDLTGKETFDNNAVQSELPLPFPSGFFKTTTALEMNSLGYLQPGNPIPYPKNIATTYSILDIPDKDDDPKIELDIMQNHRPVTKNKKEPGCFQFGGKAMVHPYAGIQNTGPAYLHNN